MQNRLNLFQKFLYSRLTLLCSCIILFLIGYSFFNSFNKLQALELEIKDLNSKKLIVQGKIRDYKQVIDYLNSDDFIVFAAKKSLGLKEKGEKSIVITDEQLDKLLILDKVDKEQKLDYSETKSQKKNYKLWWDYFFNNN